MYSAETRSISVTVEPIYLEDQSSPGDETVQLRNRYWRITDAFGRVQEVRGPGVVGVEPVLNPGECFEYTSGTPLNAPSGIMVGTYEMETPKGERFDVEVPAFSLDSPHQTVRIN